MALARRPAPLPAREDRRLPLSGPASTELTRELGLSFREVHRGAADIAGVPDETLRAFSRRRAEIEARMASRGGSSRRSAEVAALESRRAKDYGVRPATQRGEWRERAIASGLDLQAALRASGRTPEQQTESRLFARVESALTAERGSFARRHVVEELAAVHRQGASVDELESLADRFLSRARVIELGEARPAGSPASAASEPLYTTREVLPLEQRLVRRAAAHQNRRLAVAERGAVEAALGRDPALGKDQCELVRRLALGGEGASCVLGRAGAGKTRALAPLRSALEASGVEVIGAAVQNTAARILEAEAGIRSTSLTRLLYEADVKGYGLPRRGVVVIDEAGMASTRALARLQELAARDRARLVLVGDPEQLQAIEHPGAFRALVDRLGAIELAEVRRLQDPVERAAVELVRSGRGQVALAAYQERGRLTLTDSIAELEATVVADRHAAHREGADAIVLARTRARTGRLNELAQALRVAEGELGGEAIEVGEGRIHAGDLVVTRVNQGGSEPVHNRERWTVEAIDVEARTMTLRRLTERERVVTLERDYLDRRLPDAVGPVELGYAITKYGAQGMTVDRAFVMLTDGLSKEDAYVALTRARESTELYAVARESVPRAEFAPAPEVREVGVEELGREMERSEGLALAIDERLRAELERRPTTELVGELDRLEAARDDPDRRRAEALRSACAEAEADLARLRQNVAATSERDPERAYHEAVGEHAAERVRRLQAEERALPAAQIDPGVSRERASAIERILAERRRERVAAAIEVEPAYLVEAVGRRPDGLRARLEWERAVDRVERARQALGVSDRQRPLGAEPRGAEAKARWREATRELDRRRVRLAERSAPPELGRHRSHSAGLEL